MNLYKADQYFGNYVKVLEVINIKTLPGKVNRTFSMNSHGTQLQNSIGIIEIQGIHKLNGKVY